MEVMRCWWLVRASERRNLVAVRSWPYRGMQSMVLIMARHRHYSRPLCSQYDESINFRISASYQMKAIR